MHVLFITGNKRFLDEGSDERQLLSMMSEVSDSLHTVVLTTKIDGYSTQQLNEHAWVYPTNSLFSFLNYFDALSVVDHQVAWHDTFVADVILSDDPKIAGLVGLRVAEKYRRVWMVNLHDYYWGSMSLLSQLTARLTTIPLPTLLESATRVCIFSERARLYIESTATDEQKTKLISFPEVFGEPEKPRDPVDIKVKYPEFNFIVLAYASKNAATNTIDMALGTMALLRTRYPRAGLVLMTPDASQVWMQPHIVRHRAKDWVRVEKLDSHAFPFQNGNLFLYLNSGEDEDAMFIHAAAASCPLVALRSVVSEKLVQHGVNGMLVDTPDAQSAATAIRTLNEMPGLREQFQVNASMLLQQNVLPSRENLIEKLRAFLFYEYQEGAPVTDEQANQLFEHLTHKATLFEKAKARLAAIRDHYTKVGH